MSSTNTLLTTLALPWASSTAAQSGALSSSVAFCELRATSPSSWEDIRRVGDPELTLDTEVPSGNACVGQARIRPVRGLGVGGGQCHTAGRGLPGCGEAFRERVVDPPPGLGRRPREHGLVGVDGTAGCHAVAACGLLADCHVGTFTVLSFITTP
eukprot:scaffold119294_cov70-Phaeocystis_antarctica.AAC.1